MKFTLILLILGIGGYEAVQYYNDLPATAPAIAARPRAVAPPTPEPAPEPPQTPDLASVPVLGGHPLTHAKVKEIHESGILFLSDQGLVKVSFKNLPPEYLDYFGPIAVKEPAAAEPADPAAVTPAATPPPVARSKPERTSVEDAQASLAYSQAVSGLRDRLQNDQNVIDHWYKQSSFVQEGRLSENQFNMAKADFEAATIQLADLQANGP
jgi:hypothetical protein